MKTYPGFYRNADDYLYLYLDTANYYAFANARWRKADGVDILDHENDTNITHEYLQNTYGEVQSPEHAEFIVELAKNAGFVIGCSSSNPMVFEFSSDSINTYSIEPEVFAYNDESKQITIPLPPKFNKTSEILNPNNADVKLANPEPLKNAGDNLILGCEQDFKKSRVVASDLRKGMGCSDELLAKGYEWPKVGDEVVLMTGVCTVKSTADNHGVLAVTTRKGFNMLVHKSDIKKPKTPEEELRDDIKQEIFSSFAIMPELLARRDLVIELSGHIASNLIDKYKIKPQ